MRPKSPTLTAHELEIMKIVWRHERGATVRDVYEVLRGWEEPLDGDLPEGAREYVELVERELDVEISLVGTGAERERVLARR